MSDLPPLTDEELARIRASIPNLSIGADDIRRMVAAIRRLPRSEDTPLRKVAADRPGGEGMDEPKPLSEAMRPAVAEALKPEPLDDEDLAALERAANDLVPGQIAVQLPVDFTRRLVAEVRQVRALVLKLETCGRRNPGCCMGHALLDTTGQ